MYVSHKLREYAAHVWHMVRNLGASIFVSGSAQQMPANVVSGLCVVSVRSLVMQLGMTL